MTPTRSGAFQLFRFAGIDVFLHWSWFLVAAWQMSRPRGYGSFIWDVLQYVTLFLIVLMHEFGHSLACRQVGGRAEQIILWPLGGVAYVDPPQRPGATLWSIAAGPLVNVALVPVFIGLIFVGGLIGLPPDADEFLRNMLIIDLVLLAFNLLPIYPLDGGQIVRSLFWFVLGKARSLLVSTVLGFVGVAGMVVFALNMGGENRIWFLIMSAFVAMNCWNGFKYARALSRIAKLPRRPEYSCPVCKSSPPVGAYWGCGTCQIRFDTFATAATCPGCATQYEVTRCPDCGAMSAMTAWLVPPPKL